VENSGWVTPSLLGGIVRAAGVDPNALGTEIASPAVGRLQARTTAAAQAANVHQTPTFEIARTGKPLHTVETSSLSPPPFQAAVEQALSS
jgi:hypothetical protein